MEVYCKNCVYDKLGDCFYHSITHQWGEALKIARNHREMSLVLNKRNNCQYYKRKWWRFWV